MGPSEVGNSSREGTASQDGATASEEGTPQKNDAKEDLGSDAQQSQDLNWVKNQLLFYNKLPCVFNLSIDQSIIKEKIYPEQLEYLSFGWKFPLI